MINYALKYPIINLSSFSFITETNAIIVHMITGNGITNLTSSHAVRLNGGLWFGGFPRHWRSRCDWRKPAFVLHHLHGRLMTRLAQPRQEYSKQHSNHDPDTRHNQDTAIRAHPTASYHHDAHTQRISDYWDTNGQSDGSPYHTALKVREYG